MTAVATSLDPLSNTSQTPGPLDGIDHNTKLQCRVRSPGSRPSLFGYDFYHDLIQHYHLTEIITLAFTGELPTLNEHILDTVLVFGAPFLSIAHASVHAGALARLCGASTSATLGVTTIGIAEQTRTELDEHVELLSWLQGQLPLAPAQYQLDPESELAELTQRFIFQLARLGLTLPSPSERLTPMAAWLTALYHCGFTTREELEAVITWARIPIAAAEALAEHPTRFKDYPNNLPYYQYSGDQP